ncbi:MAG: phosphopantetheine-binding protein [Huintestinicola sp.]
MTTEHFIELLRTACGDELPEFDHNENLLDSGVLDSFGVITLAEELEDEGIPFEPAAVLHGDYTINKLVSLINSASK